MAMTDICYGRATPSPSGLLAAPEGGSEETRTAAADDDVLLQHPSAAAVGSGAKFEEAGEQEYPAAESERVLLLGPATSAPPSVDCERWRLTLAYDGTDYGGWQRQAGSGSGPVPTIQGEVDAALSLVFRTEIQTVGASRTDRGVHAQGQVCHFDAPRLWGPKAEPGLAHEVALRRLRRELPKAILAVSLSRCQPDFHARLSAQRKRYSYALALTDDVSPFEARYCWSCCAASSSPALDLTAMASAAAKFSVEPLNVAAFTTAPGDYEPHYHGDLRKAVKVTVQGEGPHRAVVEVSCDKFLYKMVRRLVGALVEVGRGRLRAEDLPSVSRRAVPTAPPEGLRLDEVEYPSNFTPPVQVQDTAETHSSG